MFVTEPSCDKKQAHEAKLIINKKMKHAKIHVSKLIEEHTHKTGGTAIVQNTPKHIMHPKAKTKAFEKIRGQGRVDLYGVEYSKGRTAYFFVIYGHTNGDTDPRARARTNDIVKVVQEEIRAQDPGPTFIVGDLNASTTSLPNLQDALDKGELIDVGARASLYGGKDNQETCKARPTSKGTRRD